MNRITFKHISFILFFFSLASCGTQKNKIIIDDRTNNEILIGKTDRSGFQKDFFSEWYYKEYAAYKPDESYIQKLNNSERIENIEILIVLGTWCHDSQREMPRFFKIEDQLTDIQLRYRMISVDTKKSSRDNSLKGVEFSRIPTFIFFQDGEEIGRIVESTEESLEADMYKIIQ